MTPTFRFAGPAYRAQLTVFDWSDSLASLRHQPTTFCVRVLPQRANRYCAFALGSQPYYGESVEDAWAAVRSYVPAAEFPSKLQKYLVKENQP